MRVVVLRMMKSTSLPAQFLSTFGIFVPMVLMFIVVMLPPVSIFSFMVLLLFVAMAAVEQFGLHRFQSLVLTLTCLVASIQLPVRYISILPSCHLWIQNHFPEKDHQARAWRRRSEVAGAVGGPGFVHGARGSPKEAHADGSPYAGIKLGASDAIF